MKLFRSGLLGTVGAFAIAVLLQPAVFGQTNRISGQVYGENRKPLADVYVELMNEVYTVLARAKTTGSGSFQFAGISSGRFTVLVRPFGTDYEEQSQEVEIVNIVTGGRRSSDGQNINFYLKTRKSLEKKPGAIGVVFAQEVPVDAQKAYEKALGELDSNRTDAGIIELENAVRIFPDYYYALDRLGSEMLKKNDNEAARKYFERSVAVNPKSSNSWYGLSYVLYAQGMVDESIEAAKKAVTLAPESAEINLLLGIAQRRGKQYYDAEKAMLKAKKLSNGLSADASWNLALLYVYNIRNHRLAADELENYLKLKPDHPDAEKLRRLIRQFRLGV